MMLLTMISMSLVLLGTLAWMGVGCGTHSCELYGVDFWSAWWLSWGLHFDPGTQTGIDAKEQYPQKWVVVSFSVLGFVLNLIFLGIIVEHMRVLLDSWRGMYGRIIANNHTVVLGWTDKTLFLLGELAEMMTDSQKGGGTIVVLGELDTLEMRMEVKIAFPNWRKKWRKVKVQYYTGKPYEVDDLLKVAVYAAERIIVLGCSRQPRVADSQMLTTICALRCLPEGRYITPHTNVIAELQILQNEPVVAHVASAAADSEQDHDSVEDDDDKEPTGGGVFSSCFGSSAGSGGDEVSQHPLSLTPVVGNHATNALMSICALDSSAGLALLDLMNFSGDQIETISCASFTKKSGTTTFQTLRNAFNSATPLGIKQDGQIYLAPHDDHHITPETQLLVIAADIAAALASSKLAEKDSKKNLTRDKTRVAILASHAPRRSMSPTIKAGTMLARLTRNTKHNVVEPEPTDSPVASGQPAAAAVTKLLESISDKPLPPMKRTILFIGWQSGFETLLELLDARLPPDSKVYILSKKLEARRREELQAVGLDLDGKAISDDQSGLRNCELIHEMGYTTDEKAIRRLPLATADAAVIVADADKSENESESLGGAELQIADSEALTSTILLRRLRLDCESPKPFTVVTEFVDLLTRRLLERQHDLISRAPAAPPSSAGASGKPTLPMTGTQTRVGVAEGSSNPGTPVPSTAATPSRRSSAITGGAGAAAAAGGTTKSVVFHRNYIETTALSLAAHSSTSWGTVQLLLDPHSGCKIYSLLVQDAGIPLASTHAGPVTPATEMTQRRVGGDNSVRKFDDYAEDGGETGPSPTAAAPPPPEFSFADLSDYLTGRQFGLLIGWKRKRDKEPIINPGKKDKPMRWCFGDELILLKGHEQE